MRTIKQQIGTASPRAAVLGALGVLTLGVAALSVYASYTILVPVFGAWAVPTVAALDTLWLVLQATEIIAGNNAARTRGVRGAGLALTFVIAAVPTAELAVNGSGGTDLAVILTPVAIVATKLGWALVLPALGRRVSTATRTAIDTRRQEVADRLEQMEAEAADRVELLTVARRLERRVGRAETAYRRSTLSVQKHTTDRLYDQAQETADTVADKPLPASVTAIALPSLEGWTPTAPALPVTPVTQVSGPDHSGRDDSSQEARLLVMVHAHAALGAVTAPRPGTPLDDDALRLVLRALRSIEDPPQSYRVSAGVFRRAGFVASEHRIRPVWRELTADAGESAEESEEDAEEPHR
ncbi:hypothetical protein AB0M94_39510 [Streptomyces xanthochromogenes]|uniref:hypothetical protein n=1 Tax=Streptomyces xanthochromogenes TaxID=67384 RepID=UPI003426DC6E